MKTTIKVKLIFESDKVRDNYESNDLPQFTFKYLKDVINEGQYDTEIIIDMYGGAPYEPVIIIKEK